MPALQAKLRTCNTDLPSHNVCYVLPAGYMARYNKSPAKHAVAAYAEVGRKYGLTPTQLALAWCHQRQCVTSTIIGATTSEQLKVSSSAQHNTMCVKAEGCEFN